MQDQELTLAQRPLGWTGGPELAAFGLVHGRQILAVRANDDGPIVGREHGGDLGYLSL